MCRVQEASAELVAYEFFLRSIARRRVSTRSILGTKNAARMDHLRFVIGGAMKKIMFWTALILLLVILIAKAQSTPFPQDTLSHQGLCATCLMVR